MLTRKQIRNVKFNDRTKKIVTTGAIALSMGIGLTVINTNNVEAATWKANSVKSIQSSLKASGTSAYTIKWGDTLSTITEAANNNGIKISMTRLAEINKISNIDLIYAGNKISFDGKGVDATMTVTEENGSTATYNTNSNKTIVNNNATSNSSTSNNSNTTVNSNSSNSSSNNSNSNANNGNDTVTTTPTNPGSTGDHRYVPNIANIQQLIMNKITSAGYSNAWGKPSGSAPSGGAWIETSIGGAGGYNSEVKSDEDMANLYFIGIAKDNIIKAMSDPTVIFGVPDVRTWGSNDLDNPDSSGISWGIGVPYYYDPAVGSPFDGDNY